MAMPQLLVLGLLVVTLALFLTGRWRHDVVALIALLAGVGLGLVPSQEAFRGFSHPAVITVACVLILSGALQSTGVVDLLARRVLPSHGGPTLAIGTLTALGAVLSGFMNNVGALALLIPVALQIAERQKLPPGKVLMPLSLGTMLGGMTTLIGTPSNLIVSGFRQTEAGTGFSMFDFSPVGLSVALAGLLFISLVGWRIVPTRERAGVDTFNTAAYMTEARVAAESRALGMHLRDAQIELDKVDAQIISMVRRKTRLLNPHPATRLHENDILLIEADPKTLAGALERLGLVFGEERTKSHKAADKSVSKKEVEALGDTKSTPKERTNNEGVELDLVELVILPGSSLTGRTARGASLRTRFGVNLLAISRQGSSLRSRVRGTALRQGDVLLMQGSADAIAEFATRSGCAPLARRPLRTPDRKKMLLATGIMIFSVALATLNIFPAEVSFALGVLLIMLTRVMPLRSIYQAVDWPVIVLLGALLPVAQAMETSGAGELVATALLQTLAQGSVVMALVLVLVLTMLMTDVINNAATAAIMSPIAMGAASQLGVSGDPFLIAVAMGSSCAFLTPIGHQNNTLILGPGGFRFGDYWPLGLPLEIVVISVAIPALLFFWPF